jgi:hypothetical protein
MAAFEASRRPSEHDPSCPSPTLEPEAAPRSVWRSALGCSEAVAYLASDAPNPCHRLASLPERSEGFIYVTECSTGEMLGLMDTETPVRCLAAYSLLIDGAITSRIAVGHDSGHLSLWDGESLDLIIKLQAHPAETTALSVIYPGGRDPTYQTTPLLVSAGGAIGQECDVKVRALADDLTGSGVHLCDAFPRLPSPAPQKSHAHPLPR